MAAKMTDVNLIIQAGINPKNGLPIKAGSNPCSYKEDIKRFLRIIDEQDAVNRYKWYNLPCNLTSQELERMLYYKGQLCFFYIEELEDFFFMPYALDGTIDFYGRFNSIHPVPMTSGTTENDKQYKAQLDYLSKLNLKCIYDVVPPEKLKEDSYKKYTVLLHDYTKQLSQTIISRQVVNDPLLDIMAECIPFMRTSLISGSGIKGVRVNDADQKDSVNDASKSMLNSALTGNPYLPIIGQIEFQELSNGSLLKSEEYMLAMQSLDNFRLSGYGLENGGLFEKKAHILESENDVNQSNVGLVMQDGLEIRQHFCNIVNSIWGLGIWVEANQTPNESLNFGENDENDEDNQNGGVDDANANDTTV